MQFLFAYPVGGRELIKNIRYNQLGSQTKVVYGNNVVTEYFYGLQQRLRTMTLRRPTNQLFLKNEYWYNRNSNITKFINDTSLSSQLDIGGTSDKSFEYDSYNRLKNATIKWEGMREIHDFKLNMEYNKTHGITSKVQNHRVENVYTHEIRMTDNTFKSNYLYVNAEKPHAVSNIRMVEPNYTSLHNYEYDKNGNLITSNERVGNNSVTRRLYWDDQDRLQAVVDGNEVNFYLYDASGERVIKSFGNAQNLMVNGGHVVGLSTLDDYTVYPSGYLVVGPNKYTKHYYFNNQKIASQTGDSSNFMARANKTVPQNGVLEARTANLQQQMKEVYEGANLDSPTFQARESDWEDDCGHELYDIKKRLLQEKNYDCLNVIKDLESHGLTDCEVLKEYKKAPCYLETACEEEYHQWLDYLQENGKTGCTTILKTLIEEGKSYCDVLYYIEKTTTCFEIITETDCYLEFIELYENCTRANDYLCIKYLQNLMMTSEELDYCDIVEIIKESEFNVIYPPVIPPVDTFPPVEDPVVDPGNPDNETPPVIPDEPIIPEPPFIQGKIWWYHSDHLGSSSYLTDVNGMPTHYYEYLPFGELMVEHNNSNYDNVYKFNAKELDEKTGYYYYGARYYDPRTSLFLSVDPLAEQFPNWTPYRYGFNNPIRYTDPTGMLEDDYTVNKSGKIELVRKTDDKTDKLIALDDNGKESNQSIEVDKGVLNKIKSGNNDGEKYGYMEVRGNSKATNIFEFLARNTDVEWSQTGYGVDRNYISSSYDRKTDYSSPDLLSKLVTGGFSIRMHTHSHPSPFVEGPSGFSPGEEGDRHFASQVSKYVPKMIFKVFSVVNNKYIRYDGKKIYED
ncbi:RHS repeat-associated core domain-containing protein [Flavobacterium sp. JP2137]|uniref:RHS repeat-associated core domain-containing protein n=1 Tax=Flavobacterium sp. JP2137 TaxID=3414510 RepID=UPI003D2FFF32